MNEQGCQHGRQAKTSGQTRHLESGAVYEWRRLSLSKEPEYSERAAWWLHMIFIKHKVPEFSDRYL